MVKKQILYRTPLYKSKYVWLDDLIGLLSEEKANSGYLKSDIVEYASFSSCICR